MKIKKIKLMYTRILTTMDTYVESDVTSASGIIDASKLKKGVKEYQKVLAVGTDVRNIHVGDMVCINPDRYAVRKFSKNSVKNDIMENYITGYNFNVMNYDGQDCLMLDEQDVEFIIEDYED